MHSNSKFGHGRWKDIIKVGELKRSEDEVQAFGELFIQHYFEESPNIYPFANHMNLPGSLNLYNVIPMICFAYP